MIREGLKSGKGRVPLGFTVFVVLALASVLGQEAIRLPDDHGIRSGISVGSALNARGWGLDRGLDRGLDMGLDMGLDREVRVESDVESSRDLQHYHSETATVRYKNAYRYVRVQSTGLGCATMM